jgi:hypothetical protein
VVLAYDDDGGGGGKKWGIRNLTTSQKYIFISTHFFLHP